MDFKGKKIVVLGMGKTGIATAEFLGAQGARVVVTDEKPEQCGICSMSILPGKMAGNRIQYRYFEWGACGFPSPGVPPHNDFLWRRSRKNSGYQ